MGGGGGARTSAPLLYPQAYRELALRHHPDKQPDDPQAAQRFSEYSKMYEVLGDPDMRAAYDSLRAVVEAQRKRKKEVTHVKQQMSQKVQRKREQAQQLRHKIQTLESQLATPPAQRRPSVHSGTPSPAAWQSPWPAPSTPQAHRTEGEPLVRNLCTEFEDTTVWPRLLLPCAVGAALGRTPWWGTGLCGACRHIP